MRRWLGILGTLISMTLAGGWAYGQGAPQPAPRDQQQPGVARVSMIHGNVSIQRGDSQDWVAATLNTPVAAGDRVSTGQSSRTELQLDYANVLRLSDQSQANVANLDLTHIQVQLEQGLAFYTLIGGAEAGAEIDTPNVALHPRGEGEFRIQVNQNETIAVVREGEVDLTTQEGSTPVHKGQMITIRGNGVDAQYLIADAPSKDLWDRFNEDRDKIIRNAQSWVHVDPYYTGAGDLDAYGHWIYVPDNGWVWSPTVAPDWAPYRDGNWVWEPYYGWTWVSYEPWGWAPYHYGRWFRWNGGWAWWPGPQFRRPTWAPAYVSFFGFGAGRFGLSYGFGFGFGSIGWLPIGPCDPFFPWYGAFALRFGFADFHRFHDNYFYRNRPGAFGPLASRFDGRFSNFLMAERDPHFLRGITSIRADQFGRGVAQHAVGISASEFRGGRMMTGGVPVVPTRQSLAPSRRAASPSTIRSGQEMHFFSRSQTPVMQRLPFSEQTSRVQEALRGGGAASTARGGAQRPGAPSGAAGRPGTGSPAAASTRSSTGGFSRPGNESVPVPNRGGQGMGASPEWRHLGGSGATGAPNNNRSATQANPRSTGMQSTGSSARSGTYDRSSRNYGTQNTRPQQNSAGGGKQGGWQRFSHHPAEVPAQSPAWHSNGPTSQPRYQGGFPYGRRQPPGYSNRPSYNAPRYGTRPPLNLSRPIISGPPRSAAPSRSYGGSGSSVPRGGGRPSNSSHRR